MDIKHIKTKALTTTNSKCFLSSEVHTLPRISVFILSLILTIVKKIVRGIVRGEQFYYDNYIMDFC